MSAGSRARLASHNVLSLIAPHRLADILRYYKNFWLLCLQGTRERMGEKQTSFTVKDGFLIFSAGYRNHSNKHAGVLIALNAGISEKNGFIQ